MSTDLGNDVRINITGTTGTEYWDGSETVHIYATLPLKVADIVWSMADYLKPGSLITRGAGSRIVAKFENVDTRDLHSFVAHYRKRLADGN